MYKVTDEFLSQSKKDHVMVARVDVLDSRERIVTLEGVVDGEVSTSHGDAIRRDFNTRLLVTSDFTIEDADDLLQPAGTEVRPGVGFRIAGEDEYVPQGVYEIESYTARDTNEGVEVEISGFDRSFTAQKPALKPYSLRGGTNGAEALEALVASMVPRANFLGSTDWTAPSLFYPADTDRWGEAQKLATSFGSDLGFNLDGDAVFAEWEALAGAEPVWAYREGEEGCVFTRIAKVVKTDHLRTGVVVIGTHSSLRAEVRGEAWDMRPTSPTYRFGPLGERPMRVYSELVQNVGQANAMAARLLAGVLAGSDAVQFSIPVNPALDIGDVVDIVWPRCRINGRYMISDITLNLDGSPMTVTASRGSLLWTH